MVSRWMCGCLTRFPLYPTCGFSSSWWAFSTQPRPNALLSPRCLSPLLPWTCKLVICAASRDSSRQKARFFSARTPRDNDDSTRNANNMLAHLLHTSWLWAPTKEHSSYRAYRPS
ncbi:unnamed protein product, partial [Ectocarpus sp. 8 AP-2014]